MHGRPPITSGLAVIRSRVFTEEVYLPESQARRFSRWRSRSAVVRVSYGHWWACSRGAKWRLANVNLRATRSARLAERSFLKWSCRSAHGRSAHGRSAHRRSAQRDHSKLQSRPHVPASLRQGGRRDWRKIRRERCAAAMPPTSSEPPEAAPAAGPTARRLCQLVRVVRRLWVSTLGIHWAIVNSCADLGRSWRLRDTAASATPFDAYEVLDCFVRLTEDKLGE